MSKVIVFGSFVTDLTARTPAFPMEGETVQGSSFQSGPGGKGSNQAVAAKRAGADVTFITRLGDDIFGQAALDFYRKEQLDTSNIIIDQNYATGSALIEVHEKTSQNRIVVILGACEHFTEDDLRASIPVIAGGDLLLTQLETNLDATVEAMRIAKEHGVATMFNPAPARRLPEGVLRDVDYISVNESEIETLTDIAVDSKEQCGAAAQALFAQGVKHVLLTLGSRGYYAADGVKEVFGEPLRGIQIVDTTGAGDAFNGAFAASIARGDDFFTAAAFGNIAGGLASTRVGTAPAMPMREELLMYYRRTE